MGNTEAAAALAAVAEEASAPLVGQEDMLAAARRLVASVRSKGQEKADFEERVAALAAEIHELKHKRLPELFGSAKIKSLELEPEGNMPGAVAELKPYYKASIAAEWDQEKQDAAFDALEKLGAGDLLKRTFTVEVGLRDAKLAAKVRKVLDRADLTYTEKRGVPWATLTKWVKERTENGKPLPPLDVIGAEVGHIVDVKEPKKEKGK